MGNGVFSSQQTRELIEEKAIIADSRINEKQIQPASLDLRFGDLAYEVPTSFLPRKGENIRDILKDIKTRKFNLEKNPELTRGKVYVIPLQESLALLPDLQGKTNPKSSTGRTDIFVRLIVDNYSEFDSIPPGYTGRLYSVVISQSFNIVTPPNTVLSQLRLFEGKPKLDDRKLHLKLRKNNLLYYNNKPANPKEVIINDGIYLSIKLNKGKVAYRTKNIKDLIDLSKESFYKASNFWDVIESNNKSIVIEPNRFYLFSTREQVRMPLDFAGDLEAINVSFGDFRSHYAGFFDPGFGYGANGEINGRKVTLEVRPMEHPFKLNHGQHVCKISYEEMSEIPDKVYGEKTGSHYANQVGLTLAKYFIGDIN